MTWLIYVWATDLESYRLVTTFCSARIAINSLGETGAGPCAVATFRGFTFYCYSTWFKRRAATFECGTPWRSLHWSFYYVAAIIVVCRVVAVKSLSLLLNMYCLFFPVQRVLLSVSGCRNVRRVIYTDPEKKRPIFKWILLTLKPISEKYFRYV